MRASLGDGTTAGRCEPAQGVELWFTEQVVAILAHPVQPGEYRLVVDALALDVEKRPFAQRVLDAGQRRRRRARGTVAAGHHPVMRARVVVQVVRGGHGGHGHGHYGQQRGDRHDCRFEAHHTTVFRHLWTTTTV